MIANSQFCHFTQLYNLTFLSNWKVEPELKEEGERCGNNVMEKIYGKCKPGLECVKDENALMTPDMIPSRCRAPPQGNCSF